MASPTAAVRKKLKTTDLPLSSAQRASVDSLAHKFKKKGGYDAARKESWNKLENSGLEGNLRERITSIAEAEIEKNPEQLLKLDRGKSTLLLEGAIDRANGYVDTEAQVDAMLDKMMPDIEKGVRELRAAEIGQEAANAEKARGSKTDEQYQVEWFERRNVREEQRKKEIEDLEEKERVKKQAAREARDRRREEEKKDDERRKAEREARRKADRERDEDRDRHSRGKDRSRDRDRDRDRDSGRDRYRDHDRPYDRDREERHRRRDDESTRHTSSSTKEPKYTSKDNPKDSKSSIAPKDIKDEILDTDSDRLEQEALNDLLVEGRRVASRSSRHQVELDVDKDLAPPPRKTMPASAITIKPVSGTTLVKTTADTKKVPTAPKASRVDADGFKTPLPKSADEPKLGSREKRSSHRSRSRDRRRSRSRSRRHDSRDRDHARSSRRDSRDRERGSSRRSRSRTRRRDSREREPARSSRRDSRERDRETTRSRRDSRDRDDRRRYDSRDRDYKSRDSRDHRRRDDRDRTRDDSRSRTNRRRSRSRDLRGGDRAYHNGPQLSREEQEAEKVRGIKEREVEAAEWAIARDDAAAKGIPLSFNDWQKLRLKETSKKDGIPTAPAKDLERLASATAASSSSATRSRDERPRDDRPRDGHSSRADRERSRSRPSTGRRESRIERSTSPVNIDRYVPGADRRGSTAGRDRERDRDRRTRDDREDKRKRSRSRSRRRERSRDRSRKDRERGERGERKRSRSRESRREGRERR